MSYKSRQKKLHIKQKKKFVLQALKIGTEKKIKCPIAKMFPIESTYMWWYSILYTSIKDVYIILYAFQMTQFLEAKTPLSNILKQHTSSQMLAEVLIVSVLFRVGGIDRFIKSVRFRT